MDSYEIGKRIMDIVFGTLGIIVFSPLMLLAGLYVKIVSPNGPIFADIPLRVGRGGKDFEMYKFRSMIPNAHEYLLSQPELYKEYIRNSYKLDPDPRLLSGAIFLRKSSIDEMPQFFNVIKGDMSLVGPRAYFPFELKEQIKKFPEAKKYVDQVLKVKPGITGPWQIGGRSKIGFVGRVKMDAEYANRKSLLYDLKIVFKTPLAVISSKGAY